MTAGAGSAGEGAARQSSRGSAQWPNLVAALTAIGIVVFIHRESPRTLLSAHGLLHSAILQRFQQGFELPPENPFFAGEPLGYYWFYQALGAAVSSLTGLDPLHSFELLVCLAILWMVACAAALAIRLYRSAAVGALIAFLVVAGANVQAPLLLAYRAVRVGPSVFEERPTYLWGIVHSVSSQLRYADYWGMYGPLINFFLNITARPLALCSVMGVLLAFSLALSRCTARRLALLAAAVAITSALSVLGGAAIAGSLAGALLLLRVVARTRWAESFDVQVEDGQAARLVGSLFAGLVAASPTYWHLFASSAGWEGIRFAESGIGGILRQLIKLLAACWLSLGLAVLGLGVLGRRFLGVRGASGPARGFLLAIVTGALGLIGGAAVVSLPVGNQDVFFHVALAMLAVAAPAAAIRNDGLIDAKRSWVMGLVFLPTFLLVLYCYVGRAPLPLGFDDGTIVHTGAERGALYAYIRSETPTDAVFVVDNGAPDVAMGGNTAELPALTERVLLVTRDDHYVVRPYADLGRRSRIARQLFAGDALSAADAAYLGALDRPIFVVDYHAGEGDRLQRRTLRDGAPVFERGEVTLHRFDPAAEAPEAMR
jgi:hypothetical protein